MQGEASGRSVNGYSRPPFVPERHYEFLCEQKFSQVRPGASQTRLDGPDIRARQVRDFLIPEAVDIRENERDTLIHRQALQAFLYRLAQFSALGIFLGSFLALPAKDGCRLLRFRGERVK